MRFYAVKQTCLFGIMSELHIEIKGSMKVQRQMEDI